MYNILDVSCGSKMFWFDKNRDDVLFIDKRVERIEVKDSSTKSGVRIVEIRPTIQADFTMLPFSDNQFKLVVFDPPHLNQVGENSWLRAKYGALEGNWQEMLQNGFKECFRVLVSGGVLVFKWNEYQIPLFKILKLTPKKPLFGHRSGKQSKTHWLIFMK